MSKLSAKIRLQVALNMARDIQAHNNGDLSRFDRMVNSRGKGIISRADAIATINRVLSSPDVVTFWPVTRRAMISWVMAAG